MPQPRLEHFTAKHLRSSPFTLSETARTKVLEAIVNDCTRRTWPLHAAHVRTNHVHIVVDADVKPEQALTSLKSYASRALGGTKHWARHGSTRYLWNRQASTPQSTTSSINKASEWQRTLHPLPNGRGSVCRAPNRDRKEAGA